MGRHEADDTSAYAKSATYASGTQIDSSSGVTGEERVSGTGTFHVRVYGYSGDANDYRIRAE